MHTDQGGGQRAYWAYIGSFTSGGGRGITVAAVDPETGALTPRTTFDPCVNPSCLTLARDTGVLYAVSDTEQGAARALRTGSDGSLSPLGPPVEVGASGPAYLSLAGSRLLTANYASGTVSSLSVGDDGSLSGPARSFAHRGSGPDADRQAGPHAHQVLTDPSGRWVLTVDLGTDSVRVCTLDQDTGELRGHGETLLRAGSGPRHLAFHPDGETVYVLHELEPQMTVCHWDAASGRLDPLSEVAIDTEGAPEGVRVYPSVVCVASDGRFVWAAVRGSDTLLTFSLTDGADKPRLTDGVACGGNWPRDLVADPAGRRLYVANEWSGDITWFDIDGPSGRLRHAGALSVPAAACVVFS
ncbi:lactonase family protein [Streptomyces sp. ISL-36]|uniref:lactonase family protein n=1 Tax=Streptomyces sp. ISL-36 TaxID=2819182 RepID=UPI001BE962A7|nr:lactonase family protein [Streptomyces sp. ISL-36]MBT2441769.1 lactonase family protein [Streptomyces sp. ISL-36]